MATSKETVFQYCKDNDRLLKTLELSVFISNLTKDLGISSNTARAYVSAYRKGESVTTNSLKTRREYYTDVNTMADAFDNVDLGMLEELKPESSKFVSPVVGEPKHADTIRGKCNTDDAPVDEAKLDTVDKLNVLSAPEVINAEESNLEEDNKMETPNKEVTNIVNIANEGGERSTVDVRFITGSTFIGRFEITTYKVTQFIPQGNDKDGNRLESAKLFFENEEDLDQFYRDLKNLFKLQTMLKGE